MWGFESPLSHQTPLLQGGRDGSRRGKQKEETGNRGGLLPAKVPLPHPFLHMNYARQSFTSRLRKEVLLLDGAMGTMLQARGLPPGEPPEAFMLSRPEVVRDVHRAYVDAGADILITATFGASPLRLADHPDLAGRMREINRLAVRLAREAAGPSTLVAAGLGPGESGGDAGLGGALGHLGVELARAEEVREVVRLEYALLPASAPRHGRGVLPAYGGYLALDGGYLLDDLRVGRIDVLCVAKKLERLFPGALLHLILGGLQ